MKKIITLLISLTLVFSLAGCTGEAASSGPASSASGADNKLTLTDREGREITVAAEVKSIISMAPSVTQTLVDLGLADKIIAVDTYSAGLEGLKADIPAFDMMSPDTEKMAALKPDLILATGMSTTGTSEDPFKPLTDLGIVMSYIPSSTNIAGIQEDIRFLGTVTGTTKRAEEIVTAMQKEIDDIVAKVKGADTVPTVYFEIAAAPDAYSFGKNTFIDEMLTLMGAKNIFADQEGWVSVSEEVILAANPDVIFTTVDYIENPVDEIKTRSAWAAVTAVKENKVFYIDTNKATLPNEFVTGAMQDMAKALYPDLF